MAAFPFVNKQKLIRSHCKVVICTVFAGAVVCRLFVGKRNNRSVMSKYLDIGLFPLSIYVFTLNLQLLELEIG